MRIGVISDTHGKMDTALRILPQMVDVSLIIHLGDFLEDSIYLKDNCKTKIIAIRGNCDRDPLEKDEIVLSFGSHKLFAVHGHQYGVKADLTRLYYRALELGCNIALYGHTHVPMITIYDDVLVINPKKIGRAHV